MPWENRQEHRKTNESRRQGGATDSCCFMARQHFWCGPLIRRRSPLPGIRILSKRRGDKKKFIGKSPRAATRTIRHVRDATVCDNKSRKQERERERARRNRLQIDLWMRRRCGVGVSRFTGSSHSHPSTGSAAKWTNRFRSYSDKTDRKGEKERGTARGEQQ